MNRIFILDDEPIRLKMNINIFLRSLGTINKNVTIFIPKKMSSAPVVGEIRLIDTNSLSSDIQTKFSRYVAEGSNVRTTFFEDWKDLPIKKSNSSLEVILVSKLSDANEYIHELERNKISCDAYICDILVEGGSSKPLIKELGKRHLGRVVVVTGFKDVNAIFNEVKKVARKIKSEKDSKDILVDFGKLAKRHSHVFQPNKLPTHKEIEEMHLLQGVNAAEKMLLENPNKMDPRIASVVRRIVAKREMQPLVRTARTQRRRDLYFDQLIMANKRNPSCDTPIRSSLNFQTVSKSRSKGAKCSINNLSRRKLK